MISAFFDHFDFSQIESVMLTFEFQVSKWGERYQKS